MFITEQILFILRYSHVKTDAKPSLIANFFPFCDIDTFTILSYFTIVMGALCIRWRHYIFWPVSFFLSFFFLFFPHLISAVADWMFTIVHTWCGLSANLECRSEMYCTRLAKNIGRKKIAKKSPSHHHAQLCRAISSEIGSGARHPCKFQQVSRLGSVTARHSSSGR